MSSSRSWPGRARLFQRLARGAVVVAEDLGVLQKTPACDHPLELLAGGEVVFASVLPQSRAARAWSRRRRSPRRSTCLRNSLTSVLLPEPEGAEMMKRMPATIRLSFTFH